MATRLYNAAYRVWPATFASSLPHSTSAPRPLILELEQWPTLPMTTARRTTGSAADRSTNGRAGCSTPPATWRRRTSTLPRRGASPVIKLEESSDDELYRPMPPRFGDAGQGSSRQAPPSQDNDSSPDDGDDYTTQMYSRFGM
jgi:hypothetical protein